MSFLLRNARGASGASRGQQPYRVGPPKSKAPTARPTTSRGGQMQQQLVQRRPATSQQQRTTQSTKQKSQKASQETQDGLQGVISMDEVMEDLRVLEQQQRESQQKLATDKLTKQHKLEQHSSIESKLSSLKYANGEQRAQLVRARDVLSRSTRELGTAKLRSEKSADSLKGFDRRLKKAHMSLRVLNALCRKLDTEIILFRNKKCIVFGMKTRVLDSSAASRNGLNDAKDREQSMRKTLQEERVKAKNLIEQTTSVQTDVNGLEQDLAAAQAMASSTKLRAEGIASEVIAEDNRHDVAMKDMRSTAEFTKKQVADNTARVEAVQKEIEVKKAQLLEAWKRCVQCQQEEGHELSPEPKNDGDTFSLDVNKVEATLEQERAALLLEEAERNRVSEWIRASRDEVSGLESKDGAAKEEALSIREAAEVAQKTESDRHKGNEKCLDELEEARRSVEGLRRSVLEYEETIGSVRKRCGDKQLEQSETIQNRQVELEQFQAELANAVTAIQDLEGDFAEERECDERLVEKAKQDADSARSEFEEVRKKSEMLEMGPGTDIQKEVEDILQAQSILAEDTKEEIEQLCEDFPSLEDIVFEYDPRKTVDEHAEATLSDLRSDCEARVERARIRKKAERKRLALQKEKEAAEHKAKIRAQRKEAEAARKKEERRNERILKEAKKREVDGGKHKRRSSDDGFIASVQDGVNDRFTAAEEEPLAASQKRIRFEDEEDVGSLVTNLSYGTSETQRTYGKSHSRAHGRHEAPASSKTKSTADGKVRKSSLKEPSHSRSTSAGDKIAKAREGTKSFSKKVGGNDASRDRRMSMQDNIKRLSSKDQPSRSNVDGRTAKRARDADSIASGRTAGSKSKGRLSSTSSLVDANGKMSSSRSSTQSSGREGGDSKHDDCRSLTSQSKKSRTTKDPNRDTRDSKQHASSRTSTKSSSSHREGRETKKDDGRSVSSHKSNSHTSSRPTTKPSGRKTLESKRDDNGAATSHKSSKTSSTHKSSRSVCSQKSSRSASSHKSSSKRKARESDCASQASGISTMERASKSRRRKKKDGPTAGKTKTTSFNSMGGVQDVDFHF